MYLYGCSICSFTFIQHPVQGFVTTPYGPQLQLYCPNCPNCMGRGRGFGAVKCLGRYVFAPMTAYQGGQPVYDTSPLPPTTPLPKTNPASDNPSSPVQNAVVTTSPRAIAVNPNQIDWSVTLSEELTEYIMSFLDDRSLALVGRVCKKYRDLALPLLEHFVPPMVAHGSAVAPLKGFVENELRGVQTLSLAVDKFSPDKEDDSIISCLTDMNVNVNLMLGTYNKQTLQLLTQGLENFRSLKASPRLHKMHNKFWVLDRNAVLTGSPNVSFFGLEGGNSESCIIIRSARVAGLFADYLKLLQAPDPFRGPQHESLKQALLAYNSEEHQLKLAMAPVINITDFVLENLQDAVKITIRQFLISPKNKAASGKDILTLLCGMAESGVEIEIYLDESQYEAQNFVKTAVAALLKSGCKVYVQKPVTVINAESEGLMHDKLILATLHNGVQRTLLGSAGFTIDVIANQNAENFICTDVQSVYEACLLHHQESLKKWPTTEYVLKT